MNWSGKAIGFVIGLVLGRGRWPLAAIGLVLGHLYDIGVLTGRFSPQPPRPEPPPPPANEDPKTLLGVAPPLSHEAHEQG
jgi:hypothetical protein